MSLEAQIAAYLDGELDPRAAAEVEAALVDPAALEILSEELMLRELLGSMPPDAAPEALIARLEESLGVRVGVAARLREALSSRAPTLGGVVARAARVGATGARVAASGASAARLAASGASAVRLAASGASAARLAASGASAAYALGRAVELPVPGRTAPEPLWRRAASYVWRRTRARP